MSTLVNHHQLFSLFELLFLECTQGLLTQGRPICWQRLKRKGQAWLCPAKDVSLEPDQWHSWTSGSSSLLIIRSLSFPMIISSPTIEGTVTRCLLDQIIKPSPDHQHGRTLYAGDVLLFCVGDWQAMSVQPHCKAYGWVITILPGCRQRRMPSDSRNAGLCGILQDL